MHGEKTLLEANMIAQANARRGINKVTLDSP